MRMRQKALKATGCNSAIRAINAYLKWCGSSHRVLYLKGEQRILPTFSLPDMKKLLSYKPKSGWITWSKDCGKGDCAAASAV